MEIEEKLKIYNSLRTYKGLRNAQLIRGSGLQGYLISWLNNPETIEKHLDTLIREARRLPKRPEYTRPVISEEDLRI